MMLKQKKRILIISRTPWDNNNSFGNSFSNIFGGINSFEYANIYCGIGEVNNNLVKKYYSINEKKLFKNLISKKNKSGKAFFLDKKIQEDNLSVINLKKQNKALNFFRKNRFLIFFWIRDLIWLIGRWKSKELKEFINDFDPDLIFLPIYYWPYMNRIGLFTKDFSRKKMVGYISDDNYTLKQFSLNPFFWFDRLWKRRLVKRAVDACETLYVISDIQKTDYDICFNKNCKILYKGANFIDKSNFKILNKDKINMLYSGNIGDGRHENLLKLGNIIDNLNISSDIKINFKIYTSTTLNQRIISNFKSLKSTNLFNSVSFEEIKKIQKKSDILIHTESFRLKNKLLFRHSFSTKIVDYFKAGKCILAIGPSSIASIKYLKDNQAAIICNNNKDINFAIKRILKNPNILSDYANNAWVLGLRNHNIDEIQQKLKSDLMTILN